MAIYVETLNPKQIVENIKKKIDDNKIDTWSYDADGDFVHDVDQWRYSAWLRPRIENNRVVFGILGRTDRKMSTVEYAVYHGRFVEMLLSHFDDDCNAINVTPLPVSEYDKIGEEK